MMQLDGLYIDDLMASNGEVMERYYKVEQITKNKAKDSGKRTTHPPSLTRHPPPHTSLSLSLCRQ